MATDRETEKLISRYGLEDALMFIAHKGGATVRELEDIFGIHYSTVSRRIKEIRENEDKVTLKMSRQLIKPEIKSDQPRIQQKKHCAYCDGLLDTDTTKDRLYHDNCETEKLKKLMSIVSKITVTLSNDSHGILSDVKKDSVLVKTHNREIIKVRDKRSKKEEDKKEKDLPPCIVEYRLIHTMEAED